VKHYRVKMVGRDDWQEWQIPDRSTYSSYEGWDYLYWREDGMINRVWIRLDHAQAIQMTEDE
jgi:hypothetical protein